MTGRELGIDDSSRKSLAEWARREELVGRIRDRLPAGAAANEAIDDSTYAPYLARLESELAARRRDRSMAIPQCFDFGQVPGLSNEMRELSLCLPCSLYQGSTGSVIACSPT